MSAINEKWQWLIAAASVAAYMVAVIIFKDMLFCCRLDNHATIRGILHFVLTLAIVLVNTRRLARPIRRITMALLIAAFAVVVMRYKVEYMSLAQYREVRIIVGLVFVVVSAVELLFPILRREQPGWLARTGKLMLLAAVLMLDFAAAFPNVAFAESDSEGVYISLTRNADKRLLQTYAFTVDRDNTFEKVNVLTPTDSIGLTYKCAVYQHYMNDDFMVDTLARDTIWLHGIWSKPGRKSMGNIELSALRHQWQYDMWHRLKRMCNKK